MKSELRVGTMDNVWIPVINDLNRMSIGEKVVVVECGDGDSVTVSRGSSGSGCSSSNDDSGNGGTATRMTDGDKEELIEEHEQEDDHELHFEGGSHPGPQNSSEALELFKTTVAKKKNIYSTDPVPLNSPWTFWVDRTERGVNVQQFEANLKRIYTVYTVHRFWGVYYNIPKPSDLQCRSSLHMMRDERKPVWEESYNCKGGTFRLRVQKKDTDKVWKEMLMAAIGEQLNQYVDDSDEVCGITVSIRDREDVILVWNTNAEVASEATIFDCVRLLLPDTNFLSTFYKPHETHHAFEKSRRVGGASGSKPTGRRAPPPSSSGLNL